jgi:hypothetical protein
MSPRRLRRLPVAVATAVFTLAVSVGIPGPVSAQTVPPDPTATADGACVFHERMPAVLVQITDSGVGNTFVVSVDGIAVGAVSGVYLASGDGVHHVGVDWVQGAETILDQDGRPDRVDGRGRGGRGRVRSSVHGLSAGAGAARSPGRTAAPRGHPWDHTRLVSLRVHERTAVVEVVRDLPDLPTVLRRGGATRSITGGWARPRGG